MRATVEVYEDNAGGIYAAVFGQEGLKMFSQVLSMAECLRQNSIMPLCMSFMMRMSIIPQNITEELSTKNILCLKAVT